MSPAGFELAIPAGERPQTHILERAATGISRKVRLETRNFVINERRFTATTSGSLVVG
jgi:hypothetical protein